MGRARARRFHGTYSGSAAARLCARLRVTVVLAAVLGTLGSGCSYRMGSLFGSESAERTGSVPADAASKQAAAPAESDLAVAKKAVAEVLTRDDKDAALPWENPATGARGTVTPLARAYTLDGLVCRDFLASYVREGKESWLQGGACRVHQGRWEVRAMRPWNRS